VKNDIPNVMNGARGDFNYIDRNNISYEQQQYEIFKQDRRDYLRLDEDVREEVYKNSLGYYHYIQQQKRK